MSDIFDILIPITLGVAGSLFSAFAFHVAKITEHSYIPIHMQYAPAFSSCVQFLGIPVCLLFIKDAAFLIAACAVLIFQNIVINQVCSHFRKKLIKAQSKKTEKEIHEPS